MLLGFFRRNWAIVLILLSGLFMFSDLFSYMVKWDSLDQYLPWRYFLSYSSDLGGPSLWLPYQSLGYPVYGDMQSGFWYPITWIHILAGGYGFHSFNMEVLLHLILAGIGMYFLAKRVGLKEIPAFAMGISYMACGHMVGTCHVLTFVISGTWLPWVLFALLSLRRNPSLLTAIQVALFLHLMVSGGYPAFSMLLFYFMIFFFLHWFWKENQRQVMLKYSVLVGSLVLLMGLGYMSAQIEVFPFIGRSEALPYTDFFYHNSFTLKHWWSFVFPIMISTDAAYFASDLSMINGYVGFFIFLAAVYALFKTSHPWKYGLLGLIVFALAASAGPDTPVRLWLYDYVPGFDLFRHPALFRLLAIFGIILMGGIGLDAVLEKKDKAFSGILLASAALLSVVSLYLNLALDTVPVKEVWTFFHENGECSEFGRWSHLAMISVPLSILIWAMWWLNKSEILSLRTKNIAFVLLISAEVFITTQFSVPTSVINNIRISDEIDGIHALPISACDQDPNLAIADINMNTKGSGIKGVWRNLGIWSRTTAVDGYNPFQLKSYDVLSKDSVLMKQGLVFSESGEVSMICILKDEIKAEVTMNSGGTLNLIQSPYPGWKVCVDGQGRALVAGAEVPSVELKSGAHTVSFKFENGKIIFLFWMSMILFFALSVVYMVLRVKLSNSKT
jgi:hypothetical protein